MARLPAFPVDVIDTNGAGDGVVIRLNESDVADLAAFLGALRGPVVQNGH